ncbi:MAG: phage exclusion protein Lit family protein [Pirellulales bacterium]
MSQYEIKREDLVKILARVANSPSRDINELIDEIDARFYVDRVAESFLFRARIGKPNLVTVSLKASIQLQAHSYAYGVLLAAFGNPGFRQMGDAERRKLLEPADHFLNWAVGQDAQRWLAKRGEQLPDDHILAVAAARPPDDVLNRLTETQLMFCVGLFNYAMTFIILHEIGHLKLHHGASTPEHEKAADRFAAEWLSDAASESKTDIEANRLVALCGIAVALLWITTPRVYLGPSSSDSHPEAYDRLWQVLEHIIETEDERELVWYFVSNVLFLHIHTAGYEFDDSDLPRMQCPLHEQVNYLIDRISKQDKKRR